jgi:hypothetical protein
MVQQMRLAAVAAALALAAGVSAAPGSSANDPSSVARRAIQQLCQQPYSSDMWSWAYGPAIQMSAMYEVSTNLGQNWTRSLDTRLAEFLTNTTEASGVDSDSRREGKGRSGALPASCEACAAHRAAHAARRAGTRRVT